MYVFGPPSAEEMIRGHIDVDRPTLISAMQSGGFHPALQALASKAEDVLPLWRCHDREPLPHCAKGKMVVIGDAQHPVLPHKGQGYQLGLQDAASLGVLFDGLSRPHVQHGLIEERLHIHEDLRHNRTAACILYSAVDLRGNAGQGARPEVDQYMDGLALDSTDEVNFWFAGYDVQQDARRFLEKSVQTS
jgi:salicylate hydroxylase